MASRRFVIMIASALIGACGLFPSLDELVGTDGSATDALVETSADAAHDVGTDVSEAGEASVDAGPCPSLPGPAMVHVPAGGFCIDSTEVTTTDYAAFLDAVGKGATIAQPSSGVCSWNVGVAPLTTTTSCSTDTTSATTHPNRPMSCVNWCDAYAYCAWAGKRMCGAVDGGTLPFSNPITLASQSYVACTANGTRSYPYGNSYVLGACNTKDLAEGGVPVANVKEFDACAGGYPGIYDMGGNVEEWLDSCTSGDAGGQNDSCHEFGDCFDYVANAPARCDNNDSDGRTSRGPDIGIRCCSL